MKYKNIFIMCLIAIVAAFILYRFVGYLPQNNKAANQSQEQNILATQTSTEGAVTVKATPKTLVSGSQAVFEIVFDTHSVDLNYDVAGITHLTDDEGNNYKPVSWSGGKGGHHLEGALSFSPILEKATKVTLTLSKIDGTDRVFSWDL